MLSEGRAKELYRAHGIDDAAFQMLLKPKKTRDDFYAFIAERENFFARQLEHYGFRRPQAGQAVEAIDDDDQ